MNKKHATKVKQISEVFCEEIATLMEVSVLCDTGSGSLVLSQHAFFAY